MSERTAAVGYIAIGKETTKGTAVTPSLYVPYYSQSMATDLHLISDEPVFGNKFKRFQTLQGLRSHGGSISVMAEPNTAAHFMNMLSTKGNTSGAGPYTHPFTASATTDPKSYTLDIGLGSQVVRFAGVEASKITFGWDGEKMVLNIDLSALLSFYGREILSISTVTVDLTTTYDPSPTTGLVAGDLVTVIKADGSSSLNTTISSITDLDTVVLGNSAASFAAGDMIVLRPATPSLSLLTPFLWGKTQFRFSDTAANALTAAQTRLEPGTEVSIMHEFKDNEGSKRSGAFDPASLIRTVYDVGFKAKKYFDTSADIKAWNAIAKSACVMRAYSGASNEYELRVTLNNLRTKELPIPTSSKEVIYEDITFDVVYDSSDSQAFDVKVLNNLATV